jgi:hypothetical protein
MKTLLPITVACAACSVTVASNPPPEIDANTQEKTFELSFVDGYVSYRALKFR